MSTNKLRKAVFPVAGLGTRFLPATKAMPKEMLTVVDRPIIQYVVDEALDAGIEHLIFVTGRNKSVIADHFDISFELEHTLRERGKTEALEIVEACRPRAGRTSFTRQQEPLGLGHAIWCAKDMIGDEPFAVLLPDVLVQAKKGCLAQMIDAFNATGGDNIIAVEEVPEDQTFQYGVVEVGEGGTDSVFPVTGMVEKPKPGTAPSNLIITGRYILQPEIFQFIEGQDTGAGGEIQLTDSMLALMKTQPFTGVKFEGRTFDCGSKVGFLAANVAYALARGDIAPEFRPELEAILERTG
ncbi:UTP--glucose-1-phosphate uridylyltransferase GalU [Rhodobium gokarnense]|uniref:UTP--glucose-1-phosphate uridylyltransferase n=1 Tax=Rhodobium gokarnense TaxID=364296 RepID=A0ABT3HFT5_9HYPH|nr:UTP--glucose-1-phosphate uridylyltransferase GalU [Rhodobium gokarnense]MCW2309249.1 UTP--glucose-1-phosphate uridylyltransferase [Rhodobium gokarnense]